MKVYDPDAKTRANGSAPTVDEDDPREWDEDETAAFDYSTLFDAPSYSDFIKTKPNSRAMTYEKRWQSMMKAGLIASINGEQWADAATFLKHGPGVAKAFGNLAAEDARMAQLTEMLTAPDSPYVLAVMVALPMFSQLFRNHETQIAEARESWRQRRAQRKAGNVPGKAKAKAPPITVRLGKRQIPIPVRFRIRLPRVSGVLKGFLSPTQRPDAIAAEVFNDPNVIRALHKMGMYPRQAREDAA